MEKPNHKHPAGPFSSEDLVSPVKKAKKSEEIGCDTSDGNSKDPKLPTGAEDEKQEISHGINVGEEAIAAVANRGAEEDNTSCASEEKKEFIIDADVAEDKGARHSMEDVWVVLPDASLDFPGKLRCAHFAIYDGHGGHLAAEFAKKHLHFNVLSAGLPRELVCFTCFRLIMSLLQSKTVLVSLSRSYFTFFSSVFGQNVRLLPQLDVKVAKKAILEGFRKTDELLLQESISGGWQDGATAVCVWILDQKVFIANIGDAKAVLARSSSTNELGNHTEACNPLKAIVLTREHKAIYPQERSRIQKSGGVVSSNGRLQGRLEVSRAFGDRQFKKFGVTATPDIHAFELTERESFMILGCDGLWEVFGPSDAVGFVQKLLKEGLPVSTISRRLVKEAVKERRCKDNCTAIVIVFKQG